MRGYRLLVVLMVVFLAGCLDGTAPTPQGAAPSTDTLAPSGTPPVVGPPPGAPANQTPAPLRIHHYEKTVPCATPWWTWTLNVGAQANDSCDPGTLGTPAWTTTIDLRDKGLREGASALVVLWLNWSKPASQGVEYGDLVFLLQEDWGPTAPIPYQIDSDLGSWSHRFYFGGHGSATWSRIGPHNGTVHWQPGALVQNWRISLDVVVTPESR